MNLCTSVSSAAGEYIGAVPGGDLYRSALFKFIVGMVGEHPADGEERPLDCKCRKSLARTLLRFRGMHVLRLRHLIRRSCFLQFLCSGYRVLQSCSLQSIETKFVELILSKFSAKAELMKYAQDAFTVLGAMHQREDVENSGVKIELTGTNSSHATDLKIELQRYKAWQRQVVWLLPTALHTEVMVRMWLWNQGTRPSSATAALSNILWSTYARDWKDAFGIRSLTCMRKACRHQNISLVHFSNATLE